MLDQRVFVRGQKLVPFFLALRGDNAAQVFFVEFIRDPFRLDLRVIALALHQGDAHALIELFYVGIVRVGDLQLLNAVHGWFFETPHHLLTAARLFDLFFKFAHMILRLAETCFQSTGLVCLAHL